MVAEMAELKERISREFHKGCTEIGDKYISRPLTESSLEGLREEVSEMVESIAKENRVKLTPGEVTATGTGTITIGEPYIELYNGEKCRLADWLGDL